MDFVSVHVIQLNYFHLLRYQDENTSALIMVITSTQWLTVRMTLACSLMIAAAAIGAVLVTQSPGNVASIFHSFLGPIVKVTGSFCLFWK